MSIAAFVVHAKRERVLDFLRDERRRKKRLETLWHFRDWNARCVVQLAPSPSSPRDLLWRSRARSFIPLLVIWLAALAYGLASRGCVGRS